MPCSHSYCVSAVIGLSGSTGAMAWAASGASIDQNTESTSQSASAAKADVAGERSTVENAIATASHRFAALPEVTRVVIASPDKDLSQCLVDEKVVCWDRIRNTWLDAAGVVTKFGVSPASIPDYLALVGDTADGIPGVPRWGAKSAGAVLAEYQHLENIPSSASAWRVKVRGADALSQNLEQMREQSLLYRRLATLRRDVPLVESLDDLRWRGAPEPELLALCEELGETSVLERLRSKGQTRAS